MLVPDGQAPPGRDRCDADAAEAQPQPLKGKPAPAFTLVDLQGKKVSLADYKGKAVLLNFWATWCGPCKVEIPWIVKLRDQYKSQGFEVLGIESDNYDTDPKAYASYKAGVEKSAKASGHQLPGAARRRHHLRALWGPGWAAQFLLRRPQWHRGYRQIVGLADRDEIEANIKKAIASGGE